MRSLKKLMSPKSIAIIGGGVWSEAVITQSRKFGFQGTIWSVHPTKQNTSADACFSSVSDLPFPPDAAFIGINRDATVKAVSELAAIGAGGAVCFASGFLESTAETGNGSQLKYDLIQAAQDMPILGPNCYGYINALDTTVIWPDQHGIWPCQSGVAIITQSSNIAINITMQQRGLPIGAIVTAGNQAQLGIAEIGKHLLQDPRITALGLHIEGITDSLAIFELAKLAQAQNKGIIVLKVGKSTQAQNATISHTASLSGSSQAAHAMFDRFGFGHVDDLETFVEALKILHVAGPLAGNRIASLSCSGGEASLIADMALQHNLSFPTLSKDQTTGLRRALGPKVALANPLDYHTYIWGDSAAMTECFCAILDPDTIDLACVVVDFPRPDRCDPSGWTCVLEALKAAQKRSPVPIALISSFSEGIPEELHSHGILCLNGMSAGLGAIAAAIQKPFNEIPPYPPVSCNTPTTIFEAQTKLLLSDYKIKIPDTEIVQDLAQLDAYCDANTDPFVLKTAQSAHKTETGGVCLNLNTRSDLHTAARQLNTWPLVVETMVQDVIAELLVGVMNDGVHGLQLTLGAGGIYTEILNDTVSLMLPVTKTDISRALEKLRIYPVLTGYRGKAGTNIETLVDTIFNIQNFVSDHQKTLIELEINPLLVRQYDAIAADALMRKEL